VLLLRGVLLRAVDLLAVVFDLVVLVLVSAMGLASLFVAD
jgi:hypothetical protein